MHDEPMDITVVFRIEPKKYEVLKVLADRKGTSVSEYLRQLIETGVAK